MRSLIATHLLDISAVTLRPSEPFIWSSGLKSPIYCDNRITMAYPAVRSDIASGLASLINEQFGEVEVIAGTATAGIPHAAWVSSHLQLPMAYIRDKAKGHGKQNRIEGIIRPGQKVVLVEDLISTGGSVIAAATAIQEAGGEVLGVVAIFTYELSAATTNFAAAGIPFQVLTNYSTLITIAEQNGHITALERKKLKAWRDDPESEEWLHM